MSPKKSFLILLRIVFVICSLQFVRDVFYKWDGYSYYMKFLDFLPDLSMVYILWTIPGLIFALVLWLIAYGLFKLSPKSVIPVRLEHIIAFAVFIVIPLFTKRLFLDHISISGLIGLNRFVILIIGVVLMSVVLFFWRQHIEKFINKILYGLDDKITPLVWVFAVLLVAAVPLSMIKKGSPELQYDAKDVKHMIRSDENRPNIILVVWDTLTARDMGLYGYNRKTTPFLSEWAKDAVVFNRAYSSSNWTTPGVMSIMTGQRVWTHEIWYRAVFNPVPYYKNNLARVLKDSGYDVYGLVQNKNAHPGALGIEDDFLSKDKYHIFWLKNDWWFKRLEDHFLDRPIVYKWIFENNPVAAQIQGSRPPEYTTSVPPEMIYDRFLEYISQAKSRKSKRPFFAYLHARPPHSAFLPPEPFMGTFGDAEKYNTNLKQHRNFALNAEYGPEKQKNVSILRKRYDEFILYSDNQFKVFLDQLAETIDMSNTIIIFSSDHGESFSHGYLGHLGPHLYEPLVHIPLIIKVPEKTRGTIDMPVGHIDIAPTIMDIAGVHVPEWVEGTSLLPLIKGGKVDLHPVFSVQFIKNRSFGRLITKGTISVWDGDDKLIYYLKDKKKMLFNLKSDPEEKQNLIEEDHETAQRLMKLINNNFSAAQAEISGTSGSK